MYEKNRNNWVNGFVGQHLCNTLLQNKNISLIPFQRDFFEDEIQDG